MTMRKDSLVRLKNSDTGSIVRVSPEKAKALGPQWKPTKAAAKPPTKAPAKAAAKTPAKKVEPAEAETTNDADATKSE
jgi:hypothetical protein